MNPLRRVIRSLISLASPPAIPYLAEFPFGATAPPQSTDVKDIDGLKLWHVVVTPGATNWLVTYWLSKDHFLRDGPTLARRLGTTVGNQGLVGDIGSPPIPWWKRIKPGTAVLSVAAFLGALEVISNRYDWLFAEPELLISMQHARFDVIEGDELPVPVRIVNQISTEHSDITLGAEIVSVDHQPQRLTLGVDRIPQLAGSASKDIAAIVTLAKAGSYRLRVAADASAGALRSRKHFETYGDVKVWPKLPAGRIQIREVHGPNAFLSGLLTVGPPALNGLDCELEILEVPGLRFGGMFDMPFDHSAPLWNSAGKGLDSAAVLRWSVGVVPEGKKELGVDVVVSRDGHTDWASVMQNARFLCQYRREKFRHE